VCLSLIACRFVAYRFVAYRFAYRFVASLIAYRFVAYRFAYRFVASLIQLIYPLLFSKLNDVPKCSMPILYAIRSIGVSCSK
jgi:hypothetical protein